MAYDVETGRTVYSTDDLISLARLNAFGPKSNVVFAALTQLKLYETNYPLLIEELKSLRANVKVVGSVEEIVLDNTTTEPPKKKK
jgi:hypothetical protein